MSNDATTAYLDTLKQLFLSYLEDYPGIEMYLFGSRAQGNAGRYSDVDIGLLAKKKIEAKTIMDLKDIAEKSDIPYEVDVVDLATVNEAFKASAMKGAILWTKD